MKKRLLRRIPVKTADENMILTAEMLRESSIQYIISGQSEKIADENILLLNFFSVSGIISGGITPKLRVFLTKSDYITQRLDYEPKRWHTGAIDHIMWECCWIERSLVSDGNTPALIRQFTGNYDEKPLKSLREHQNRIKAARLNAKHHVIKDKIDDKMRLIGDMPVDFDEWLDRTGFGDKYYLFYKYRNIKKKHGYCTACHTQVRVEKPKHNHDGICPNCGEKIIFKTEGKSGNVRDRKIISLFQKTPDGFAVRYFDVSRRYPDMRKPVFSLFEIYRTFYENGGFDSYRYGKFRQTHNVRWCDSPYTCGWVSALYCRNIVGAASDTPYRYCAIGEYAGRAPGEQIYVHGYLREYRDYPYIEYLTKLNLYRLIDEITTGKYVNKGPKGAKNLEEALGVKKQHLKILRELDASHEELELVREFAKANLTLTADSFRQIISRFGGIYLAKSAAALSKYASIERMEKYCLKHEDEFRGFKNAFAFWKDYVGFCEQLGYDLTNDFVLFPKNLKKAHDLANERLERKHKAARLKRLKNMNKGMKKYFAELKKIYGFDTGGEYIITAPSSLNEIIDEGNALRHCVGTYAEKVAEKRTVILFIRRKTDMQTPFYTIEVNDGKIIQCYGKCHAVMTDDVEKFVEAFRKSVLTAAENRPAV